MKRYPSRGVTLVELIVALSILATMLALAAPGFSTWIVNARIRTTAEALSAGLYAAKAEAVSRNARVRFQLTDTLDNSCVLSTTGRNWVINLDPAADADAVAGSCASAASDTVAPQILQSRSSIDGSRATAVQGSVSSLVFNGLGRLTPVPAGEISFDIRGPAADDCSTAGGELSCLRVLVSPAGQVRMCNPRLGAADPQGCP